MKIPDTIYLYRITHIDNLDFILKSKVISCPNSDNCDPNFIGIGDSSLIQSRKSRKTPIVPNGDFSDYVALYFGARPPVKLRKFSTAIIARVFKVLLLINKMESDLLLDFKDDLIKLGELIVDNDVIMKTAIKHGLDVNWLINVEIPKDIAIIHKNLKNNGYLK